MSDDLFSAEQKTTSQSHRPLAVRMRPKTLEQYVGQEHLLGVGQSLRKSLAQGAIHSMILWGPPGVGKTSLAMLMAHYVQAEFVEVSAVLSGVKDIRMAAEKAKNRLSQGMGPTVIFVDEVHRFNKSQQDAFLPLVEEGILIFIGATTENPSFEVNNALLSRCRVYLLKALEERHLEAMILEALKNREAGLGERALSLEDEALNALVKQADGDARRAYNLLELAADLVENNNSISLETLGSIIGDKIRSFDKGGDLFYEQISALHKSVRGSDPNASLYWFVRMLDGGCDPLYIARRVVRMASEDIGNADPRALTIAMQAWDVQTRLGSPEGELSIAQAIVYLAAAAKSNAVYNAYKHALRDVKDSPSYDVPMHLRNAPTSTMKSLGFGSSYRYAHDEDEAYAAGEHYFPDELEAREYYKPVPRGLEQQIAKKLARLRELDAHYQAEQYPKEQRQAKHQRPEKS